MERPHVPWTSIFIRQSPTPTRKLGVDSKFCCQSLHQPRIGFHFCFWCNPLKKSSKIFKNVQHKFLQNLVKTNPNSNSNFRQSLQQPRIGIRFSFFVSSFAETRQIHFHIKTIYYLLEVWTSPDFKVGLDSKFFCWWYSLHQPWIGFHFYSIFCKTELTICYVFFV